MNSFHSLIFALTCAMYIPFIQAKVVRISNEDEYNQEIMNNKKQMLVEFSADWCSVCNAVQKPLEEIASDPEFDHITFVQVDVDKLDNVSKQNGIVGVPTFLYLENGTKKVEEIGVQSMPTFKDHLRKNLRKTFNVTQSMPESMEGMPSQIQEVEVAEVDVEMPAAAPAQECGFFMRIFNAIKNFIALIFCKIKGFFTMIFDAIKGFFGG